MTVVATEEQVPTSLSGKHWQLELTLGLMAFFVGFNALLTASFLPSALQGWGDFRQLYTGGYMFRVGERQNLYDYDTQLRYEQRLVPIPTHLPVNHLAYEHLLFVPLSLLPYKPAYVIFFAVNIGLAVLTVLWLLPVGRNLTSRCRFFVPALVAAFLPVWRALLQGQDSILLLTLLAAAMFLADKRHAFEAGLFVGAGMFKFQIVLPIALLFLAWRQWRFVWGFCVSSAVAVAISFWMVGAHGMHQYLQMMAGMSLQLTSQADVLRYATSPLVMLNLRGLITGLFGRVLPHVWVQGVVGVSSICVLALAAKVPHSRKVCETRGTPDPPTSTKPGQACSASEFDILKPEWDSSRQFSLAVLAASLVSYHFIEHDASILIIPVATALASLSTWRGAAAAAVIVGTLAGTAPDYAFFGAVPVLALFITELM
jgi:Glycosyltransferase family 87